jgi:hypothetical protein
MRNNTKFRKFNLNRTCARDEKLIIVHRDGGRGNHVVWGYSWTPWGGHHAVREGIRLQPTLNIAQSIRAVGSTQHYIQWVSGLRRNFHDGVANSSNYSVLHSEHGAELRKEHLCLS